MTQPTTPAQAWAQHFDDIRNWLDPAAAETALAAAEARGYRKAITALRDRAQQLCRTNNPSSWARAIELDQTADFLEAIAEEGK